MVDCFQVPLRGDSQIKITALPAGHMIGGAMWRITRHDEEDIIYAVDYNHKKERHLNGCSFDSLLVYRTVRQNGDCAIVIDTGGRVLEIAHLLDQLWANTQSGLQKYNLVMMSHVAASVVEFAKSQVEWMSDKGHIFAPSVGEVVDATVASHIYRILLSDELFESLEFIKADVQPMETDQHIDKCMLSALSGDAPFRDVVYVNDPKLSEMKQLLINMGYSAEFSSGVLYIGGVISIRRNEAGRFHIEGCAGPLYLKLRDIILEQFMVL
ncbi:hypothetical protein TELCIR_14224 [Teladorsagia circumcincta]|uniref:Cleavage and polyadenylation specificity factor subunit 2 n=1 Tax=Teladorsagia circumcincta TaxID=45464 RepID=A0A2G9U1N0_TELCI|nr:hypothetical protein TELCIR_14224 [Teladorsagia circumcincta]